MSIQKDSLAGSAPPRRLPLFVIMGGKGEKGRRKVGGKQAESARKVSEKREKRKDAGREVEKNLDRSFLV